MFKHSMDEPNSANMRKGKTYKGKLYSANGEILYDGDLTDGKPNGWGKEYNRNGSLKYEGVFRNGGADGDSVTVWDPWGNYYIGKMVHGRKNGHGSLCYSGGQLLYCGKFSNNEPHG